MSSKILLAFIFCFSNVCFAQPSIIWEDMSSIQTNRNDDLIIVYDNIEDTSFISSKTLKLNNSGWSLVLWTMNRGKNPARPESVFFTLKKQWDNKSSVRDPVKIHFGTVNITNFNWHRIVPKKSKDHPEQASESVNQFASKIPLKDFITNMSNPITVEIGNETFKVGTEQTRAFGTLVSELKTP